jgi:hypothetical protein
MLPEDEGVKNPEVARKPVDYSGTCFPVAAGN